MPTLTVSSIRRFAACSAAIARDATDTHEAMATAYASGAYSLSEIGQFLQALQHGKPQCSQEIKS